MAKTLTLDVTRKLFNQIFVIPAMLVSTVDFFSFYTAFTDLDHAWGSQGQLKVVVVSFPFF